MTYTPSPRPTFDGPAHIPYEAARRHLWGDAVSGEVADWIYVSSEKIHQLVFGLPAGGMFRHSEAHRTVFAADEIYYVLSGVLLCSNPETGEVHRALPGEAVFFRRDTWHHAMNGSAEPLRVLEYFAPPPAQGTSGAYARTRPYLSSVRYTRDELLGRWPMAQEEVRRSETMRVLREADLLWRLEGRERQVPVALLCSTEHLTVGRLRLLPGQHSEPQVHGGDECLYVLEGALHVRLPEAQGARWFELKPGDGFYIPQGEPHQYYNVSGAPAELIFGVAPRYLGTLKE
ncbi:MAG TPA: cupin domain-containing protein [Roseiflexaceae bacterium]|nr:cupin domain-containing protein [Roseiflexaceae bacterium]